MSDNTETPGPQVIRLPMDNLTAGTHGTGFFLTKGDVVLAFWVNQSALETTDPGTLTVGLTGDTYDDPALLFDSGTQANAISLDTDVDFAAANYAEDGTGGQPVPSVFAANNSYTMIMADAAPHEITYTLEKTQTEFRGEIYLVLVRPQP